MGPFTGNVVFAPREPEPLRLGPEHPNYWVVTRTTVEIEVEKLQSQVASLTAEMTAMRLALEALLAELKPKPATPGHTLSRALLADNPRAQFEVDE